MPNLDLKKTYKRLYAPSTDQVTVIDVPTMPYLMIDGEGDPNSSTRYPLAIEALYGMAYGIRAICKAAGKVFTVMPLEGLWGFKDEGRQHNFDLTAEDKADFWWTLMILQPDFVTPQMVEQARETVRRKKSPELLDAVRFEAHNEGEVVSIMHVGSYADEGPTVKRLHDHIAENGWQLSGKHHEIYLSDPRKVESARLKTVIRQPFSRN